MPSFVPKYSEAIPYWLNIIVVICFRSYLLLQLFAYLFVLAEIRESLSQRIDLRCAR